jgi:hypothetical protein
MALLSCLRLPGTDVGVVPRLFQYYPQMLLMFLNTLGVDKYVVDKDYDKLIQLIHKYFVHEVHKIGRGIG